MTIRFPSKKQFRHWLADEETYEEKWKRFASSFWKKLTAASSGMQCPYAVCNKAYRYASCLFAKKYILRIWQVASVLLLAVSSVSIYLLVEKDDFPVI